MNRVLCAALFMSGSCLLAASSSERTLVFADGSAVGGAVEYCVDGTEESTAADKNCKDKVQTNYDPKTNTTIQKCCRDATEVDTKCKNAKTKTLKICEYTSPTCSGKDWYRQSVGSGPWNQWAISTVDCTMKYSKASEKAVADCIPSP